MTHSVRIQANVRMQEIDVKIQEESEQIRKREAMLHGTDDTGVQKGIQEKIGENRTNIVNLEAEKNRVKQEQDQHATYWGMCILITLLVVVLAASVGIRHAHQSRLKAAEVHRIETVRREAFETARQSVIAYLGGIEEQVRVISDTPIEFTEDTLDVLKRQMQSETEINQSGELAAQAEVLKVAVSEYNRQIERRPFDIPYRTARNSAEQARNEFPFEPSLLNKEALHAAEEHAQSIEDAQNVQNLQREFDRIRRLSYQQSFERQLALAKSFLEQKEIDMATVPLETGRVFFDTHKEAMQPGAEANLQTLETEHKLLVQSRENEKVVGDFAALFNRAEQSYQGATQNPDDIRDDLLDTDALDRAKQLFADITVSDQTRFSELETRFTTLKNNAVAQRSQKLAATIEDFSLEHRRIIADNGLTPPQRYNALTEVLLKIRRLVEETERETINRRSVTELVQTKLDQLFAGMQHDWQEVYPQAITQTVGDLELYLTELQYISSLRDFRSPDFLKVLENPDSFCFATTRSWNQFVNENGTDLNIYPPSFHLVENILNLLDKDTTGLASVPEVVLIKTHRQYYEETRLRSGRLRNQMLQFRRNYKVKVPYIEMINKKITDIADSATSPRQAMLALLYLLEQIADEKSESPCLRLHVIGTLLNDLVLTHRDFLYSTVSWRSRSHQFLTMFDDSRCLDQTCTHHKEAGRLLADFPIDSLRRAAQTLPAVSLPEPPRELRNRNFAVEYIWVGWADRNEANPPEVVIRIRQENMPKTNFESALYAKLPDTETMSVVGTLTDNQAGIVPANQKDIRCGTPVYIRRQWVPES